MLLMEIKRGAIYLTTNNPDEMIEAAEFLRREYDNMKKDGVGQRTIYDFREKRNVIPKPA